VENGRQALTNLVLLPPYLKTQQTLYEPMETDGLCRLFESVRRQVQASFETHCARAIERAINATRHVISMLFVN
jgi:hypothetical protein